MREGEARGGGPDAGAREGSPSSWAIRLLGAALLLLTLTPLYRILDRPETGRFGGGAVTQADANLEAAWWGLGVALVLGAALAFLFPSEGVRRRLGRWGQGLTAVPPGLFAVLCGGAAASLSLLMGLWLFRGLPTLVDGMVALLQARMVVGGALALPLPSPEAAWLIPNTVLTPEGWISQYPPFPSLLQALGLGLGAPWTVGPALVGITVAFSTLVAHRLCPREPRVVRLGGILMAVSPFLLILGSGYLSHVPAAAFGAVGLYATLRARDEGWAWAILTGLASGAMVTSRPWLGLLTGVALPVSLWAGAAWKLVRPGWLAGRLAGAVLGGLPVALLWGWYNRHFFGHPLRMGYTVAFGPAHDLGFHVDPWGNAYGLAEGFGFTAHDLLNLGVYLLETPIPAVALVGAYLLLRPAISPGAKVLLAWALLPVLGNAFYWHHGTHLGPRMLYEPAPAWILLAAMATLGLTRGSLGPAPGSRFRPADILLWSLLASGLAIPVLGANRALSYRWEAETVARVRAPAIPEAPRALVFVHGSWAERVAARLQAGGMRLDSIESALRRNDLCRLQRYAVLREESRRGQSSGVPLPSVDFQLLAGTPQSLEAVYITEGNRILVDPREPLPPECRREAGADRGGIVSLAPLLWQGDLPGMEAGRPMFVRDLGPRDNQGVLDAHPDRRPYVLLIPAPGWDPVVREYEEGMRSLWGEEIPAP